ncbi:hypothetical protein Dimus_020124, partial [Dionaea muscipula]
VVLSSLAVDDGAAEVVISGEQESASSSPWQWRRAAAQGSTVVCGWSSRRRRWQRPVVHDSMMAEGAGRWCDVYSSAGYQWLVMTERIEDDGLWREGDGKSWLGFLMLQQARHGEC